MKYNSSQLLNIQKFGPSPSIQNSMYRIAICIPTYKRPLMLKKLILSIIDSNINQSVVNDINIIVVDNDVDKSAEKIIEDMKERCYNFSGLHYISYSKKGLVNVRNKLFNAALEYNPDFIVGIDDDLAFRRQRTDDAYALFQCDGGAVERT